MMIEGEMTIVVMIGRHTVNMMIEKHLDGVREVEVGVEVVVLIEIVVTEVETGILRKTVTIDIVGIINKDMVGIVSHLIGTI
jgi:hypothetical protein